ncbi:MAG: hypothetical protein Q9159_001938 [Coniocarpon cinnabarinum]
MGHHDDDSDKGKDKSKDKDKDKEKDDQDTDKDKKKHKHKDKDDESPPPKAVPRKKKPAGRSLPDKVRLSIHAAGVPDLKVPSLPKMKPATKRFIQDAFWGILLCFCVPPFLFFLYLNRPSPGAAPAPARPPPSRPVLTETPTPSMKPAKPGYHWTPPASKPSPAPHPKVEHVRPMAPVRRLTITTLGNIAACYPSYGGLWSKTVSPLELEWLGLDATHDTDRSLYQEGEDDFCESLEKIGAAWFAPRHYPAEGETAPARNPVGIFKPARWRAVASSASAKIPAGVIAPVKEDTTLFDAAGGRFLDEAIPQLRGYEVAWPSEYGAGACVWNERMISLRADREDWMDGWTEPAKSGIDNALTMEERCDAILRWGGKYCARRTSCPRAGRLFGLPLGEKGTSVAGHMTQKPRRQNVQGRGRARGEERADKEDGAPKRQAWGPPPGRPQAGRRRGGTIW